MRLLQQSTSTSEPTGWHASRLRSYSVVPLVFLVVMGVFNANRISKGYIAIANGISSSITDNRSLVGSGSGSGSPCTPQIQGGGAEGQQHQLEEQEEGEGEDTYTLVVVRCKANITWIEQVPSDWRVVVYEKCGKDTAAEVPSVTMTTHTPANMGAEECNGYFDYMHDYYYNLTTVTVFMHDDPFLFMKKAQKAHTPFQNFTSIEYGTKQFVTKEHPFLHFGLREMMEAWGTDRYHGNAERILWPYFGLPVAGSPTATTTATKMTLANPPKELSFKPSAHMAVRKEQIQKRPQSTYFALLQQVRFGRLGGQQARQFCCAMERTWHIFFGEPAILPKRAIASDLLNFTQCNHCHKVST